MKSTKPQTSASGILAAFLTTPQAWFFRMLAAVIAGCILTGPAAAGEPFGTQLGNFNDVPIYSNETATYVSNTYNTVKDAQGQDYVSGMRWQCVEFVNRLYLQVYAKKIRIAGTDASGYFGSAAARGLTAYPNGSTTPPEAGDIICFSGGPGGLGHVSIARSRSDSALFVAQQNVRCTAGDAEFRHGFTVQNGTYRVDASALGASYVCQGWLRVPAADGGKSRMVSPMDGSTLSGGTTTFTWSAAPWAIEYSLALGSTPGGRDYWIGSMGTSKSVTFSGLPLDGSVLYVTLGTRFSPGWQYSEATLHCADFRAAMTSPQPNSTLPGAKATFIWTPGREVQEYFLYWGTSKGSNDLWGGSLGTRTSVTFSGLPTDGGTLWLRLWSRTPSGWASADYQYRAARW